MLGGDEVLGYESQMSEKSKQPFPRDRAGEIFQDDLGEDHTADPRVREDAAHEMHLDPDVDSEEADEFMRKQYKENEK